MITCQRCGKDNQDHYKFCLGCGSELTHPPKEQGDVAMMKTMMADLGPATAVPGGRSPTPPAGVRPAPGLPGMPPPSGPGRAPSAPPAGLQPPPGMGAPPQGPPPGFGPPPGMGAPPQGPPPGFGPPPGMGAPPQGPPPGFGPPPGAPARPMTGPPSSSPYGAPPGPPPGMGGGPMAPPGPPPGFGGPPPGPPPGFGGPPPGPPPGFGGPPPGFGAPPAGPPPGVPASATGPAAAGGTRPCPTCGNEVPASFKFCGACGSAVPAAGPPRATADIAAQPKMQQDKVRATMTLIRPDGSEGGIHHLAEGENRVGREHGPVFENDGYLSPTHAELVVNAAGAVVRDLDSLNGVFVKMTEEEEIKSGQIIRLGQELLRFDSIEPPEPLEDGTEVMGSPNPGYWGKITVIIGNSVDASAFPLLGDSVTMGRERGDINFPDDGYVSGLHARIFTRNGKVFISDLGSSNGTFIKLQGERKIRNRDFVLLGQQLFRVEIKS